jgi:hypothetical protein
VFVFVFTLLVLIHVLVITNKIYYIICSLIVESIVFDRRTLSYVSRLQQRGWLLRPQGWTLPADLTVTSWRDCRTATTPACLHNYSRS